MPTAGFSSIQYFWLIGLGLGVGVYGTFLGAGGGFVLMPILLLLYPRVVPEHLTPISLAVVFFNTLAGSETYAMMKRIDYRSGLMLPLPLSRGRFLGLSTPPRSPASVHGIFGSVLLACALFMRVRPKTPEERGLEPEYSHHHYEARRHLEATGGEIYDYTFNPLVEIFIALLVGYASTFWALAGVSSMFRA